jgi:predicted nucleic acid-binding protein
MILVDTSVWVDHLRHSNSRLQSLLHGNEVTMHPFVLGELACGTLKNRAEILRHMRSLPAAVLPEHDEVMALVEAKRLWGLGLGWIDVHLLASAMLSGANIWTFDKALSMAAEKLKVGV